MIRRIGVSTVALFALLDALGDTAFAQADAGDAQFLSMLRSEGINDLVSPAHAIEAGHTVCEKLDQGMTPTEVAVDVLNSSSMPGYHSGFFVSAAIKAYCPQYTPTESKPGNT